MSPLVASDAFDFDRFGQALGWQPWPYSSQGTY
jgi:hypothetical protein